MKKRTAKAAKNSESGVSAKKAVDSPLAPEADELRIEHLSLKRSYPVMEVAKLAAMSPGLSMNDRFQEAIDLLVYAEEMALKGKWGIEEEVSIKMGADNEARFEESRKDHERHEGRVKLAESLCASAARQGGSGQILRAPLILTACKRAGKKIENEAHSNRIFNQWVKYAAVVRSRELTHERMHSPGGPGSWPINPAEALAHKGAADASAQAVADFAARFETGRPLVFRDDEVAKWIVLDFLIYLEGMARPKKKTRIYRSTEDGQEGRFASKRNGSATQKRKAPPK